MVHEGTDETNNRKARPSGVSDRGPTTTAVPTENGARDVYAAHCVDPSDKFYATRRHLKDVRSTSGVEHIWSSKKAREGLTVPAIADATKAGTRRDLLCSAVHVAAPTAKRKVSRVLGHNANDGRVVLLTLLSHAGLSVMMLRLSSSADDIITISPGSK
jgi:hypothetical protein